MARYIERGESLLIPFKNGKSILDSQCKPRMYKSVQNFEKTFPKHNYGTQNIELVEYSEIKYGEWMIHQNREYWHYDCPFCDDGFLTETKMMSPPNFCSNCGAKMQSTISQVNTAPSERSDT